MRSRETLSLLLALALVATACGGTTGGTTHDVDASTKDSSPAAKEAGKTHDAHVADVDLCSLSASACPASFNPSKPCDAASEPCRWPLCEQCSENAYDLADQLWLADGGIGPVMDAGGD